MSKEAKVSVLALAVVSILRATSVHAQDAESGSPPEVDATGSPPAEAATGGGFEEVVVTAQRRSEALERTPVAVSAIGTETMQKLAIVTDADLQAALPGLMVKAGANSNQLNYAIRGQSLDAFSGVLPGVLPYFNEVQVAGGGSTTLYDLQSVQALKGPQGTLFGRNSTGGTVLFTSNKPTNDFGGYAAAAGGNFGLVRAEGALNLPIVEDKVLARIAMFSQTTDGYQHDSFRDRDVGGMDRFAVRGSLTVMPTDRLTNELVVDYANAEGTSTSDVIYTIYPTGSTNAPAPANFLFTPAMEALFGPGAWDTYVAAHPGVDPAGIVEFAATQKKRGPYDITISSLPFLVSNNLIVSNVTSYDLTDNVQFKNIIGYTNLRNTTGAEYDGSPYIVDERGEQGGNNHTEQFSEEAQLIGKAFDDKFTYVTGVYFNDEKTIETTLSQIIGLEPFLPVTNQINSGETKRQSYAAYGQGTYDLSEATGIEGLSFTLGGRYTSEDVSLEHLPGDVFRENPNPGYQSIQEDTFDEFSWNVGIEEQLNSDVLLYLHARSSVRNGGFNFFAPPLPGFGDEGGSEYDVERATDIEFGTKYKGMLGDTPARLNVALYYLEVEDAQRVTYVSLFGAPAAVTVNVPETRITGLELDGALNPAPWLTLGGSVNYADAEFTENDVSVLGAPPVQFGPVPDIAEWSGTAYFDINVPVGDTLLASFRTDVFAQSEISFSSTGDTDNPGTDLPGYGLVNLRLGLENPDSGWSVAGIVKNVGDKVYYVGGLGFGSLFTYNLAVPGEPRTYQFELRYSF